MRDDISELLKEAKPLYFARKTRRRRIKAALAMLVCVVMLQSFYPRSEPLPDYNWYDAFALTDSTVADNTSVIEQMGLPTDDMGFLMVV